MKGRNIDPGTGRQVTYFNDFADESSISKMATKYMWDRGTIINREHQFYVDPEWKKGTPFHFGPEGLRITAKKTPPALAETGMPFVSGVLTTNHVKEPFGQKYGRWTVRARLPKGGSGCWPGIWLLPMNFNKLQQGENVLPEIDIMEAVFDVNEGVYHATAHSRYFESPVRGKLSQDGTKVQTGRDLVNEFHDYGFEWTADSMTWLFNGVVVKQLDTPEDMHDVRHLLLNLAVGGWGGEVDPTKFPAHFDVAHVEVLAPLTGDEEPLPAPAPMPQDEGQGVPLPSTPQVSTEPQDVADTVDGLTRRYTMTDAELGRRVAILLRLHETWS